MKVGICSCVYKVMRNLEKHEQLMFCPVSHSRCSSIEVTLLVLWYLLVTYLAAKKRILGECLLISSLLGKALRMLVESRGLPSSKPSLVNLITKVANLVFYLSLNFKLVIMM